jgi:RND family efflux transporter MFP subunit
MSTINPTSPPPVLPSSVAPPPRNGETAPAPTKLVLPTRPRRSAWLAGLAWKLVLAAVALAIVGWAVSRLAGSRSDARTEITATAVTATLPITVTERGELESSKIVAARCEIEGHQNKIVEILPEGTRVTKGQQVARFDAEQLTKQFADQEIKWKQAEGKAKAAKSKLEQAKNKAEGEIAKANLDLTIAELEREKYLDGDYDVEVKDKEGAIALAKRDLEEAEEKLKHYRTFLKKGFGTEEQLRLKVQEVAKAKYYLERDQEKLRVLQTYTKKKQVTELTAKAEDAKRAKARAISSGDAAIAEAQSDLEAAEITARLEQQAMERAKRQLDRCIIHAPQDGILVYAKDRPWDPNARIQAGAMVHFQQNIFSLPDLSNMQVKVKIHESMIKKVKPGQKAEIQLEALPNHVLHGTVKEVATLADNRGYWDERGVKEYITIVVIDDLPSDAGLKPGMTAEVKIMVAEYPGVLLVPVQAVAQLEGKHYAYVVGPGGVEKRVVQVGENNEKLVEVRTGLDEGEQVALDARARIAAEAKDAPKDAVAEPGKDKDKEKEKAKAAEAPQPAPAPAPMKR